MKKYVALFLTCLFLLNTCVIIGFAEEDEEEIYATGALPMTEEEVAEFKNTVPEIIDVKPNQLYIDRINEEFDEDSLALMGFPSNVAADGEEIVTSMDAELELLENNEIAIPAAVDNSKEKTFPFIGNQGNLNSCVGWSFGYYQLTNNANKIRGTEARSAYSNTYSNIYSPNWIYNLGNDGKNDGMTMRCAANVLYTYGCPNVSQVPITTSSLISTNYLNWYPSTNIWESAIYNKSDLYFGDLNPDGQGTFITSPDSHKLENLKKILANGYVVTVLTTVDALEKTVPEHKIGRTSSGRDEYVWTEVRDFPNGGHAVTIVGYDDNYKVDINEDGIYQTGEYGAFKIANSWGGSAKNHNNGYIWLAYDALNEESSVLDSVNSNRIPALQNDLYYFVKPQKEYKPLLTATVGMKTNSRGNIRMQLGVEAVEDITKSFEKNISDMVYVNYAGREKTLTENIAFWSGGGCYNLSGNTSNSIEYVVLDLTGLLKGVDMKKNKCYNFYIKVEDFYEDSEITIQSLYLKNHYNDEIYECVNLPLSTSAENYVIEVDIPFVSNISTIKENKKITLIFNSKINESSLDDSIKLMNGNEEPQNINIHLSPNKEKAVLMKQDSLFESGFYKINILSSLVSEGGNTLGTTIEYPMYIPYH